MNTKYLHYRAVDESAKSKTNPHGILSRTGATVAYAQPDDKSPIVYSMAYCHPFDNFNKSLGRAKAGGRLKSEYYRSLSEQTDREAFRAEMDEVMAEYGYTRIDHVKKSAS
jgi:hypothetical protein